MATKKAEPDIAGDNITVADIIAVVPGADANSVTDVKVLGTTIVTVPPAAAKAVLSSIQNFPAALPAKLTERVLSGAVLAGTVYAYLVDEKTGPVNNGDVPNESATGYKKSQPPIIIGSDKADGKKGHFLAGDAFYELSTGLYWVCTTAGDIKAARFTPNVGVAKESLVEWSAAWGPVNDYTFDYVGIGKKTRTATGDVGAAVAYPADPSKFDDAKYTAAVKLAAAKLALPPNGVIVRDAGAIIGVADPDSKDATFKTKSEDALRARFAELYVANNVVHPSAVSYLIAALNSEADLRKEDLFDIKPSWPYDGGDGTAGDDKTGVFPAGLSGTSGAPNTPAPEDPVIPPLVPPAAPAQTGGTGTGTGTTSP